MLMVRLVLHQNMRKMGFQRGFPSTVSAVSKLLDFLVMTVTNARLRRAALDGKFP